MKPNVYRYWYSKLEATSFFLSDTKKVALTKAALIRVVGISPEDADFFLSYDLYSPNKNPDELLRYSVVERVVGTHYACGTEMSEEESQQRTANFIADFGTIMDDAFSPKEIRGFTELMGSGDEMFVLIKLVGPRHHAVRRIRNAYLPMITDFTAVDIATGQGRNITHTLFNGSMDPVETIDRIVGD